MSKFNNLIIVKLVAIILFVLKMFFGEEIFRKRPDYENN